MMFCAHPGGAFDDSGGTLCHHVERGDDVTVVIVTTGAMFTDEKRKPQGVRNEKLAPASAEDIAEFKAQEILAAGCLPFIYASVCFQLFLFAFFLHYIFLIMDGWPKRDDLQRKIELGTSMTIGQGPA